MRADRLIVRRAAKSDLARIAEIHLQAYSRRHFTSRLPARVLQRYYGSFLEGEAEVHVLSAPTEGGREIIGFAVFGRGVGAKLTEFKRTNAVAILKASLRHPFAAGVKLLQRVWNRATQPTPMAAADYLLLSIAVSRPQALAGAEAGGILLDHLLARAQKSGANCVGLYVNSDNVAAMNAYVRRGFRFRELHGDQFYMERSSHTVTI